MAPVVDMLSDMLRSNLAYVRDGHVLCVANAAPQLLHDFPLAPHLRDSYDDVLLWSPYSALGIKPCKCLEAPWSTGHPTINATRLLDSWS